MKKNNNPEIPIHITVKKKNEKKQQQQTKNPLATHPQNTLAQPLDLDFLLIK